MAECALPQMFGNKMVQAPDLVLVVGGEGVLGGKLFYDLLRAEFNIRCLTRLEDEARIDRKPGVEFFYCDPLNGDIPEAAFEGVKFVVNAVSPLNSGCLPSADSEALERLNNVLITRSKAKGIARYVVISSANIDRDASAPGAWPGIAWHVEYSVINSGVPYTILRSGILLGEQNAGPIGQISSQRGLFPLLGRRSGPLYVSPIGLVTETVARTLKTEQSANRTYAVTLDEPVTRRELPGLAGSTGKARKAASWEADVQIQLASIRTQTDALPVTELELRTQEFEHQPRPA